MPAERDFAEDLLAAGERHLAVLGPAIEAADPRGLVEPRSRLLCAGLGLLAEAAYGALGGARRIDDVGRVAAMLSLVTKIDDQVIDGRAFHAGEERGALRAKTRAFLAPTLASIRAARPANDEPRCALAASLGEALRDLGGPRARLERVIQTIAHGWEVQVDAVATLTRHPASVTVEEVDAVTRSISGAWLLMIAMIGTLPGDASRAFTREEEEAFFVWGGAIQRADALADLEKDLGDGHLSSWVGRALWDRAPASYRDALHRGDVAAIYALVRAHGVHRDALPDADEAARLARALPALGDVPLLLAWIHRYLVGRYENHPLRVAGAIAGDARASDATGIGCSAP